MPMELCAPMVTAGGRVVLGHLLEGARVGHAAEAEAAVLFRDDQAERAELLELVDEALGEVPLAVPLAEVVDASARGALDTRRSPHAPDAVCCGAF
jgi:hypothetical protein